VAGFIEFSITRQVKFKSFSRAVSLAFPKRIFLVGITSNLRRGEYNGRA
jgi:hypothetical protein